VASVGGKVVHLVLVVDTIPFLQVVVINLEVVEVVTILVGMLLVVEAVTILAVCIRREAADAGK